MKRISLLALSATAAMAQAPKAAAPVAAPAPAPAPVTYAPAPVSYASAPVATEATTESSAPLAPIHDDLLMGNPALPASIAWVLVAPSDMAGGKREAAFQWNGGAGSFNGSGLAIIDNYFGAFGTKGGQGELTGGYIATAFGAGLRMNFHKSGFTTDTVPTAVPTVTERSDTYAPTSIGVFGSLPLMGLTVYGRLDYGTPSSYYSQTTKTIVGNTTTEVTTSNRSDAMTLSVGAATEAKGDRGLSWNSNLGLGYVNVRPQGTNADSTHPRYTVTLDGTAGKSFSAEKFILAPGLKAAIGYWNEFGARNTVFANGHDFEGNADYGYSVVLTPSLATILPIFEHWILKGSAGSTITYKYEDVFVGSKAVGYNDLVSAELAGAFGIRYERGRWAAEAMVNSALLGNGPYFISGSNSTVTETVGTGPTAITTSYSSPMLASFAITANFK